MTKRTLVLRKESLAALATDELAAVAGARPVRPSEDCPDYTYYCILTGRIVCTLVHDTALCA